MDLLIEVSAVSGLVVSAIIVWFWTSRPRTALIVAMLSLIIISIIPWIGVAVWFTLTERTGDPQLLTKVISTLTKYVISISVIWFPILALFQWVSRKRLGSKQDVDTNSP